MLPSGDVFWEVAALSIGVVRLAQLAADFPGRDVIEANVKLLAIVGMSVFRVRLGVAVGTEGRLSGALESVIQN